MHNVISAKTFHVTQSERHSKKVIFFLKTSEENNENFDTGSLIKQNKHYT